MLLTHIHLPFIILIKIYPYLILTGFLNFVDQLEVLNYNRRNLHANRILYSKPHNFKFIGNGQRLIRFQAVCVQV